LLSRALAARGDPNVLFWSFATNLVTMLVVDIALIPVLGAVGAAIGSVVAPAAGVAVCARAYRRRGVSLRQFVPGAADVGRVRDLALRGLGRFRPR
jgi:peptidoglycan biosynthesis protein MviN/MurJ (putative lipid II flippase)